jgi:hypothetical protein
LLAATRRRTFGNRWSQCLRSEVKELSSKFADPKALLLYCLQVFGF